jgi:hypothetical protein
MRAQGGEMSCNAAAAGTVTAAAALPACRTRRPTGLLARRPGSTAAAGAAAPAAAAVSHGHGDKVLVMRGLGVPV